MIQDYDHWPEHLGSPVVKRINLISTTTRVVIQVSYSSPPSWLPPFLPSPLVPPLEGVVRTSLQRGPILTLSEFIAKNEKIDAPIKSTGSPSYFK